MTYHEELDRRARFLAEASAVLPEIRAAIESAIGGALASPDPRAELQRLKDRITGQPGNTMIQIGMGGTGPDTRIPECPLCRCYGGGGHGGYCPNMGKDPEHWISELPPGMTGRPLLERRWS